MFVIRASNLVLAHNLTLGGTNRDRLFAYTQSSLRYQLMDSEYCTQTGCNTGGTTGCCCGEFGFFKHSLQSIGEYTEPLKGDAFDCVLECVLQ